MPQHNARHTKSQQLGHALNCHLSISAMQKHHWAPHRTQRQRTRGVRHGLCVGFSAASQCVRCVQHWHVCNPPASSSFKPPHPTDIHTQSRVQPQCTPHTHAQPRAAASQQTHQKPHTSQALIQPTTLLQSVDKPTSLPVPSEGRNRRELTTRRYVSSL